MISLGTLAVLLFMAASGDGMELLAADRTDTNGVPSGWDLRVKRGTPKITRAVDDSRAAVCLDSDRSSFSIQRAVNIDPEKHAELTWRWRADVLPARGDFRVESQDDQAAQLFVGFGRRAINYIWDTTAPVGESGDYWIPLVITIKTVVVASGAQETKSWRSVRRNVRDDYRHYFHEDPPRITGIRFQVNSQHTSTHARGCISSIIFLD